jgi:hypothetical protein
MRCVRRRNEADGPLQILVPALRISQNLQRRDVGIRNPQILRMVNDSRYSA